MLSRVRPQTWSMSCCAVNRAWTRDPGHANGNVRGRRDRCYAAVRWIADSSSASSISTESTIAVKRSSSYLSDVQKKFKLKSCPVACFDFDEHHAYGLRK
jgi:hypothetical protein